MADDVKSREAAKTRARRATRYQSARKPKLRGPVAKPPPLPALASPDGVGGFGEAAEDGLRMLAALETMPSLEPDFGEDLASEASVTIIERFVTDTGAQTQDSVEGAPEGSLRARLGDVTTPLDIDADDHAAYIGPVEEAVVEIVDVGRALEPGLEPEPGPDREPLRRRRVPRRLLKALTGEDD